MRRTPPASPSMRGRTNKISTDGYTPTSESPTLNEWVAALFIALLIVGFIVVFITQLLFPPTYWHEVCYVDGRKVFDEILLHDGNWVIANTGKAVKMTFDNCVRVAVDPPFVNIGK